jgi:dihydroorotase
MKTLICKGEVIDPANGLDREVLDLLIVNGKIACISKDITTDNANVIDATGLIIVPGLIDMHVHLREPGQEHKETIQTGTRAAVKGGFTSVLAMANTNPVADSPQVINYVRTCAKELGVVNVFTVGSVTIGLLGENPVNISELVNAGAIALSDDGKPVMNPQLMKDALVACKKHNIPLIDHCEWIDKKYEGWVMNEGEVSKKLGLIGIPNSAEERMVARDIKLAEETGAHLHIAHVSTAGSVELVRDAKKKLINVTAEATPHHFTLTDSAVEKYGANAKMNPPLRSKKDVELTLSQQIMRHTQNMRKQRD